MSCWSAFTFLPAVVAAAGGAAAGGAAAAAVDDSFFTSAVEEIDPETTSVFCTGDGAALVSVDPTGVAVGIGTFVASSVNRIGTSVTGVLSAIVVEVDEKGAEGGAHFFLLALGFFFLSTLSILSRAMTLQT